MKQVGIFQDAAMAAAWWPAAGAHPTPQAYAIDPETGAV